MKGYIIAIITISLIGGIVSTLIPANNAKIKKHLSFIISLIFLIIIISPIKDIVDKTNHLKSTVDSFVSNISSYVDYSNNLIINTSIDKISTGIKEAIINEFNLKSEDVKIELIVNDKIVDAIQINKVQIYLFNEATWQDENKIKDFIEDLTGSKVLIIKK